MTKKELIDALAPFGEDEGVVVTDGEGWSNIETVTSNGITISIMQEKYPVFSDN